MERRRFTAEFKREAVKLARQDGVSRAKVAQELGLNVTMLTRWVREVQEGKWDMAPGKPLRTEQQQELERLRRELKRVTTERDILKKAVGYFAKEPS
jgi:transposase